MLLDTLRDHGGCTERPQLEGLPGEAPAVAPTLDALLDELDGLIGLESVKHEVKLIVNLTRVERMRREHGLPVPDRSRHLVFSGNPGTGKTTVARLVVADLRRARRAAQRPPRRDRPRRSRLGLRGPDRREGHRGRAIRARRHAVHRRGLRAHGAEQRRLRRRGRRHAPQAYGRRPRAPHCRRRGVHPTMHDFVASNPGLQSRFAKTIAFPDYTADQLVEMFRGARRRRPSITPTTLSSGKSGRASTGSDGARHSATAGSSATSSKPRSRATPPGSPRSTTRRASSSRRSPPPTCPTPGQLG